MSIEESNFRIMPQLSASNYVGVGAAIDDPEVAASIRIAEKRWDVDDPRFSEFTARERAATSTKKAGIGTGLLIALGLFGAYKLFGREK